ncbi:MAG: putative signal transducing protein [Actinomycetota bacterium]
MDDELVVVYEGGGGIANAEMIKGLLESNGIETGIRSGSVPMYPVNVGHLGGFAILVRREDAEQAAALLEAVLEGADEEDEDSN